MGKEKSKTSIIPVKFMRSAAVITIASMLFSCFFFYCGEDINYAVSGMEAPPLLRLDYTQPKKGKYRATLKWKAKKGKTYQILRKTKAKGSYKVLATVKARSAKPTYKDNSIGKNKQYTYTARRVELNGKKVKALGKYDKEGLTTIVVPSLKVKFTNLKADLSWKKVKGVSKYLIQRRVGKSDKFYEIKSVKSKVSSFTDWFYLSTHGQKSKKYSKKLAGIITARLRGIFLDASNNPVSYRVQGYYSKKVGLVKKESYGLFLTDGEFRLETPTIVSLSDSGVLRWGTVANAEGYRIYKSTDGKDGNWTKVTDVKHTGSDYIPATGATNKQIYQQYQLSGFKKSLYYTVRAYASKNGKRVFSSYDKTFTRKNSNKSEKVLIVGDSISFGSPYYENEKDNFSYANRLTQLTGVSVFNPSIPGATYHYGTKLNESQEDMEEETDSSTSKLVTGVMQMLRNGENADKLQDYHPELGVNRSHLYDYDVMVLAGGTNDYLHYDKSLSDPAKLIGSREIDSEKVGDKTTGLSFSVNKGTAYEKNYTGQNYDYNIKTFDGAYNQIMKWIEEASVYRIQHGLKPIQVVAMSMFYSDRSKTPYTTPTDRNTTENSLGLTLTDYQDELDALNTAWSKKHENTNVIRIFRYDTQNAGILYKKTCPYLTADNLHLTKSTYASYGSDLSDFMTEYFLGKETDANTGSAEFLTLAAKYGMLKERLLYLEELAGSDLDLYSSEFNAYADSKKRGAAAEDPIVSEADEYIRLLAEYGYLEQLFAECTDEEAARFHQYIEDNNVLGERVPDDQESALSAGSNRDMMAAQGSEDEADGSEEGQYEKLDPAEEQKNSQNDDQIMDVPQYGEDQDKEDGSAGSYEDDE